jgi:uncharacterized protein YkwD
MRKAAVILLVFALWGMLASPATRPASSLPPPPSNKPPVRPDASEERRAFDLYELARKGNRTLTWDQCLARKAFLRAKELVKNNYFEHLDPVTGRNPAWDMVRRCQRYRYAGENLTKGMDAPENIHKALMSSPTHRRNLINPRFSRIGIACYDFVCVELFAGY